MLWLFFLEPELLILWTYRLTWVLLLINACYFSFAHDRCICTWQNFIIRFFVVYILTLRKLELPFYIILDFRDYSEFRSYSYRSVVIKLLISISIYGMWIKFIIACLSLSLLFDMTVRHAPLNIRRNRMSVHGWWKILRLNSLERSEHCRDFRGQQCIFSLRVLINRLTLFFKCTCSGLRKFWFLCDPIEKEGVWQPLSLTFDIDASRLVGSYHMLSTLRSVPIWDTTSYLQFIDTGECMFLYKWRPIFPIAQQIGCTKMKMNTKK